MGVSNNRDMDRLENPLPRKKKSALTTSQRKQRGSGRRARGGGGGKSWEKRRRGRKRVCFPLSVRSLWSWKSNAVQFLDACGGIQDFSAPRLPPCSLCADPSQASQRHNSLMSILISVSHTFIFPTEKGRRRKGYKGRGKGGRRKRWRDESFRKALDSQSGAFFLKTAGESALCL